MSSCGVDRPVGEAWMERIWTERAAVEKDRPQRRQTRAEALRGLREGIADTFVGRVYGLDALERDG